MLDDQKKTQNKRFPVKTYILLGFVNIFFLLVSIGQIDGSFCEIASFERGGYVFAIDVFKPSDTTLGCMFVNVFV